MGPTISLELDVDDGEVENYEVRVLENTFINISIKDRSLFRHTLVFCFTCAFVFD